MEKGVRQTLRYKLWMAVILDSDHHYTVSDSRGSLISMYLKGTEPHRRSGILLFMGNSIYGSCFWDFRHFMMVQVCSASTLRECGETVLPMKAGIVAVLINLIFNYLLIYGKFGFPETGVRGGCWPQCSPDMWKPALS